jgi:hypothetical protein
MRSPASSYQLNGIRKYEIRVIYNGITSITHFDKPEQMAQKLKWMTQPDKTVHTTGKYAYLRKEIKHLYKK